MHAALIMITYIEKKIHENELIYPIDNYSLDNGQTIQVNC